MRLCGAHKLTATLCLHNLHVTLVTPPVHCRTTTTVGIISKQQGSTIILNNTIDQQGSVCTPDFLDLPDITRPNASTQILASAGAGSNWCVAAASVSPQAAAGQHSNLSNNASQLAPQHLPTLLVNRSGHSICSQPALLLGAVARSERLVPYVLSNTSPEEQQQQRQERPSFNVVAARSAVLCEHPISVACVDANGTGA